VEFEFLMDGELRTITLEKNKDNFTAVVGNRKYEADIHYISRNILSILIAGRSYKVYLVGNTAQRSLSLDGLLFDIQERPEEGVEFSGGDHQSLEDQLRIKAPMPGKVIKINVSEKEKVRKKQTLLIVEAMKMENEIKSSIDGSVKKIHAAPGDLVGPADVIIELEAE